MEAKPLQEARSRLQAAETEAKSRETALATAEAEAREARIAGDPVKAEEIARAIPDLESGVKAAREEVKGLRAAVETLERTHGQRARFGHLRRRLEVLCKNVALLDEIDLVLVPIRELVEKWASLSQAENDIASALGESNPGRCAVPGVLCGMLNLLAPGGQARWGLDGLHKAAVEAVQRMEAEVQTFARELGPEAKEGEAHVED